ncbi:MAG TPA: hypothetical protein VIK53_18075, partial [Verrucomicrobiae bacterium]
QRSNPVKAAKRGRRRTQIRALQLLVTDLTMAKNSSGKNHPVLQQPARERKSLLTHWVDG